jgi:hypothetical protein
MRPNSNPPTRLVACPNPACLYEWEEAGAEEYVSHLRQQLREVTPGYGLY